ncbi:hypothetical protein [Rhodalgimonas zhirmunskyi]|uniref:Uncharacterized protein n=1 Tax=Rhodalgimonas zhirmunskyi TaxID=2964767 RepID=A0AAJ1X418_9RHOB|nr:hypothetical protein [Rhodoalgimonas zhirmunskyi]MDQ2092659.1 hypothetical protein [Rhodoalgimonas zhirmunskyi]
MTLFFALLALIAALITLRLWQEWAWAAKVQDQAEHIVVDHTLSASWGSHCGCFARPRLIPRDPEDYARYMAPRKGTTQ